MVFKLRPRGELSHDGPVGKLDAEYAFHGRFPLPPARGRFFPDTIRVAPGTPIQLVIGNTAPGVRKALERFRAERRDTVLASPDPSLA